MNLNTHWNEPVWTGSQIVVDEEIVPLSFHRTAHYFLSHSGRTAIGCARNDCQSAARGCRAIFHQFGDDVEQLKGSFRLHNDRVQVSHRKAGTVRCCHLQR